MLLPVPIRHGRPCAFHPRFAKSIARSHWVSPARRPRLPIHHAGTPQEHRDATVVAREELHGLDASVRHSRAVATLTKDEIAQVTLGRTGTEHEHLDALPANE
jgi:hypothetical protein